MGLFTTDEARGDAALFVRGEIADVPNLRDAGQATGAPTAGEVVEAPPLFTRDEAGPTVLPTRKPRRQRPKQEDALF